MYLFFSSWANKDFGEDMIRHRCFASKAILKLSKSLKSIPPWAFGSHIYLHETQWSFLSSFFYPHQKLAIKLFML